MSASAEIEQALIDELRSILGPEQVITELREREFYSADLYVAGQTCAGVIRPSQTAGLASALAAITRANYACIARGGGMTYTAGYTPPEAQCIIVDLSAMSGIVALDTDSMSVTCHAGTSWETLFDALAERGLRLPFFGTLSGRQATVGGGLSNGALFLGSARYGSAADQVLGMEIVLADGRIIRTGQAALKNGTDSYRAAGPDLTGLFVHDGGALGIKTQASFPLIETPACSEGLSYVVPDALTAARALSSLARSGAVEEAYVFDPETTARNTGSKTLKQDLRRLLAIAGNENNVFTGVRRALTAALAGRKPIPAQRWSIHMICAGRTRAGLDGDLGICRKRMHELGALEIPPSVPTAIRASPFDNLNAVLGPEGERWAALNAKLPHARAAELISAFDALLTRHADSMQAHKVSVSQLYLAIGTQTFSFEPVFHWADSWLPMHRRTPAPEHLRQLTEPQENKAARELVEKLRIETVALFGEFGAASNQIGRTYPLMQQLNSNTADLLGVIKKELDPANTMNPGVLGFEPGRANRGSDTSHD